MTSDLYHVARFRTFRRTALAVATTSALALVAVACGGDNSGDAGSAPEPTLSEAATRGESLLNSNGCAACHGPDWQGGAGPSLAGLYNTERTLADGTVVLADDAYLTAAIAEPGSQVVEGYSLRMPGNSLDDAQIADVIEFIKAIGPADASGEPTDGAANDE